MKRLVDDKATDEFGNSQEVIVAQQLKRLGFQRQRVHKDAFEHEWLGYQCKKDGVNTMVWLGDHDTAVMYNILPSESKHLHLREFIENCYVRTELPQVYASGFLTATAGAIGVAYHRLPEVVEKMVMGDVVSDDRGPAAIAYMGVASLVLLGIRALGRQMRKRSIRVMEDSRGLLYGNYALQQIGTLVKEADDRERTSELERQVAEEPEGEADLASQVRDTAADEEPAAADASETMGERS